MQSSDRGVHSLHHFETAVLAKLFFENNFFYLPFSLSDTFLFKSIVTQTYTIIIEPTSTYR